MIKLVTFIDLNGNYELTVCQECGCVVHRTLKEEHQKWHTTVWLLNPQHRMLR